MKGLQMEILFLFGSLFTPFSCFVSRFRASCFSGSVISKFELGDFFVKLRGYLGSEF